MIQYQTAVTKWMKPATNYRNRTSGLFSILLGMTIIVWLLRGFEVLTTIPGGVIWLLVILTIGTGIFSRLQSRWRRF